VSAGSKKLLVDCGLFQGFKQLRLRNWESLPISPSQIDTVILTHAHLDHTGYLPLLVNEGFSGKVYCTAGTRDLCAILLPDSGYLQEEDADRANRHRYSKHAPALPLYTREDAERSLGYFHPVDMDRDVDLGDGLTLRFMPAGHILGSSLVFLRNGERSILFSGDLGRPRDRLMNPPAVIRKTDYLVIESTYGNRRHDPTDPKKALGAVINRTVERGGILLIPSFAVGRTQSLLHYLRLLKSEKTIPDIPVFLNSPMAIEATDIFCRYSKEHRLTPADCKAMCEGARFVKTTQESKGLNLLPAPMIVISASGMATGGRVLHHIKAWAPDSRNTILFVGFQAGGTRGEALINGVPSVKIHGEYVPVEAEIVSLESLSAHSDYAEILEWLGGFEASPKITFITHGEPPAADALRHRIEEQLHWRCRVPEYLEAVTLK
jgi:metallo-beta-lactamase family protein